MSDPVPDDGIDLSSLTEDPVFQVLLLEANLAAADLFLAFEDEDSGGWDW